VEKTRLTPEHPGTAVRWDGQIFEVLDVDALEGGGVRYTLALWDEQHAIRVVDSYDEATEAGRQHEREVRARRERHRLLSLVLAPLLGLLPADVQQQIENDYAMPGTRLTIVSAVPLLLFGAFSLVAMWLVVFNGPELLPFPLTLLGVYFWIESLVRLTVCMTQGRPVGSILGSLPWGLMELIQGLRGKHAPARGAPHPESPSSERDAQDSFHLLEPVLSFLDVGDQATLHELFGFDGVRWGRITAIVLLVAVGPLLVATVGGMLLAPAPGDVLLLLVTGVLFFEQVFRLAKLARGGLAPSLLRFLVRPLARRLLDAGAE
jgi:hypothetical protein